LLSSWRVDNNAKKRVRIGHHRELGKAYSRSLISSPSRNFLGSTFVNVKSLRDTDDEQHLHLVDPIAKAAAKGRDSAGGVVDDSPTEEALRWSM
jgi:hypothetical protein